MVPGMSMRLISFVPSKMRFTRLSRYARSMGYSSTNPYPPWIWSASSAAWARASEPHTFRMDASMLYSSTAAMTSPSCSGEPRGAAERATRPSMRPVVR